MMTQFDLNGLRVLNTRPEAQGQALNQAIKDAGGEAISCPALTILPTPSASWLPALPPLLTIQYAIFTSVNAVHCFCDGLELISKLATNWPNPITVIAIGKTTAQALEKRNIAVQFIPTEADSEHLLALPVLQHIKNHTVLLIKGSGGRSLIPETLTARGANLISLDVYRRTIPELNHDELTRLWQNDAIDIIVFTSQEAMRNLFVLFGAQAQEWLQQKPCLVISPRLAQEAAIMGMKNSIVCQQDTLLAALHQHQGRLAYEKKLRHANTNCG